MTPLALPVRLLAFALLCGGCATSAPVVVPPSPLERVSKHIGFIEVEGARLRWLDTADGEGVPWLFVHGIGGRMEDFDALIPAAAQRHRVIALDLAGFGQSTNPERDFRLGFFVQQLRSLLDTLELKKVRLVCHSLGGQICLSLTLDDPARVDTLVLVDAAGTYDSRTYARDILKRSIQVNLGKSEGANNPLLGLLGGGDQTLIKRVFGTSSFALAGLASFKTNLRSRVGRLRVPALIIWGVDDKVFPVEEAVFLKENIPDSRLHLIEGAGHTPFEAHHLAILTWIEDFLDNQQKELE